MRPTVEELRAYYATRDGQRVARQLAATIAPAIRRGTTARLLGLGYCAPLLTGLDPAKLERLALVMPHDMGAHRWPYGRPGCTTRADEFNLPFAEAMFDQALLVHALEFAEPPRKLLRELWRVLAPGGELVLIVPNRLGLWTHFEATPFGQGRPWGKGELTRLLRDSMFEPVSARTALVAPPVRGLRWLDRPLMRVARRFGGIHFLLARKTDGLAATMIGRVEAAPVQAAASGLPIAVETPRRQKE
ncbi:methyltransferase domain-containing protein [Sphingoaurantiacus capsulatus]|uniref:Methyltransferase domain-containing protein n=1 Tax=Sphingoaurantiacus capsulatus TaxID=1771310 RepID=A0ABV7X717_9SPHN